MIKSSDYDWIYPVYRYFRLTLFFVVMVIAAYEGVRGIVIAIREPSPTHLSIEHWDKYAGQNWVSVDGQFAGDRAVLMPAGDKSSREQHYVNAFVPIVASAEKADDEPIHAVAVVGPGTEYDVSKFLRESSGDITVSGLIAPDGYNTSKIFPRGNIDPNVIYIHANSTPDTGFGSWLCTALALFMVFACCYMIYRDYKNRKIRKSDAAILSRMGIS